MDGTAKKYSTDLSREERQHLLKSFRDVAPAISAFVGSDSFTIFAVYTRGKPYASQLDTEFELNGRGGTYLYYELYGWYGKDGKIVTRGIHSPLVDDKKIVVVDERFTPGISYRIVRDIKHHERTHKVRSKDTRIVTALDSTLRSPTDIYRKQLLLRLYPNEEGSIMELQDFDREHKFFAERTGSKLRDLQHPEPFIVESNPDAAFYGFALALYLDQNNIKTDHTTLPHLEPLDEHGRLMAGKNVIFLGEEGEDAAHIRELKDPLHIRTIDVVDAKAIEKFREAAYRQSGR